MSSSTPEAIICGTVSLDDIKTPFGKLNGALGGSAAYAALSASIFARPGVVAPIGADFPKAHLDILSSHGIDTDGLEAKGKTFRWSGEYEFDMNQAKTLKTELNCLANFIPKLPERYKKAQYVFLANCDPDVQHALLVQFPKKPLVLTDSMNYWIKSKKSELLKIIKMTDILLVNEAETRQICNCPNLIKGGRLLLTYGPKYVIVKKGEHGALLLSHKNFFSAPAYPLENAVDPTGAGDSFAGALIGYLAKTKKTDEANLRKAVIFATSAASFTTEGMGTQKIEKINLRDIKKRYEEIKKHRTF
jgi:ribokinase